ncbi:hypothetical protein D3C87_1674620 [compost metagenome]
MPGFEDVAQEICIPIKMRGKNKIPAELRGKLCTFDAGTEQEFHRRSGGKRRRVDAVVLNVCSRREPAIELRQLIGEIPLLFLMQATLQSTGGKR